MESSPNFLSFLLCYYDYPTPVTIPVTEDGTEILVKAVESLEPEAGLIRCWVHEMGSVPQQGSRPG